MKSRQFCSVCKDWLEMEVVPTSDGNEDDGVIWFRCPRCQGFLPKLSGADLAGGEPEEKPQGSSEDTPLAGASADSADDGEMRWNSPAEMMAEQESAAELKPAASPFLPEDDAEAPDPEPEQGADRVTAREQKKAEEPTEPVEPIAEYAALLADADVADATPYRPWGSYEVGQCVHHLAWEECGIVVAKEELPGGRQVIKCYFGEAGVVRLIEQAPR